VNVTSEYWLEGFSRVWQQDAAAEEDTAIRGWYRDLLAPYLPPAVARTLDAGCGSGRVTSVLAQLCPAAFHVAIDGSGEAVSRTALRMRREGIAGTARQVDLTAAGFSRRLLAEHGRFDVITGFFVLHHYPMEILVGVLKELRELLARGGVIVLAECHDPDDAHAAATERTCAELARLAGQPADLLLTPDVLQAACREAGFGREEMRFEARPGHPFSERERGRHSETLARLQARVESLAERAGPLKLPELRQLETLVAGMRADSICGPARHPPTLAVLRGPVNTCNRR
jgi:SAM-dependent methyltransferase